MFRDFLKEAGHPAVTSPPAKRRRSTELLLHVTLEELFQGCVKQVAVQRQRLQGAARTRYQVGAVWAGNCRWQLQHVTWQRQAAAQQQLTACWILL